MENLDTTKVKASRAIAPRRDAYIALLIPLSVRASDLAAMIEGLDVEVADEWFAGSCLIPDEWKSSVREALRHFLDNAEFMLGQAAVRDPLFAASLRFAEFAGRINKARRQLETLHV